MNVLIVDDDQTIRSFLRRILEGRLKCRVTEAENGKQALDVLQKARPDFMLMDISMPAMSGDELLGKIREMPEFRDLPVIVLSAVSDKEMIGKLLTIGISEYMLKPMEVKTTIERIKIFMNSIESKKHSGAGLQASASVENGSVNLSASA